MTEQDQQQRTRVYNRRSLAILFDQYHQPIYQYIYRRVGDVERSRELTADVFHSLLRTVRHGNPPEVSARAWLYRTAHNLVIDEYRRRQHRNHLALSDVNPSIDEDLDGQAQQHIAAAAARQALQSLPESQQQVLVLKYLEGFTNSEVADIIGKSVGAVKALQHRGLTNLQQRLAPEQDPFG